MEPILSVPENPELKEAREKRLQDILSNESSNNNSNTNPTPTPIESIEKKIENSITNPSSTTSKQDEEEEKEIKWTKFKIMEASDGEEEQVQDHVEQQQQTQESQNFELEPESTLLETPFDKSNLNPNLQELESSEIKVEDIDFTFSLQDNNENNDGEEEQGTSTNLYELD